MTAPSAYDFDLIVIGGGSGGVRGARMAAAKGVKVALVEGDRLGGTCVIRGCVPKKLLSFAAHGFEEIDALAGYGYTVTQPQFNWAQLIEAKDREIDRLEEVYAHVLKSAGVTVLRGWARFLDPHRIEVSGKTWRAERFLIATGGQAALPDMPGKEHFITSTQAFHLPELPREVLVYGGGYIGVEFAGIFSGLGVATHLAFRSDKPLRGFDEEVRAHFTDALAHKPLSLLAGQEIHALDALGDGRKRATFADGSAVTVDVALAATGRTPWTQSLALPAAGVATNDRGAIQVDPLSQTSAPHIYAVGDVTDRMALTPVAINEAMAFVDTVYGGQPRALSYTNIATAVFSNPEVCTVGLTEAQARAFSPRGRIYTASFRALAHVLPDRPDRTFMKMLVDDRDDRVLGLHVVGLHAAEMVQGFAVALTAGLTKAQIDATVGIHPTSAEELVTLRTPSGHWR